MDAYLEYFVSPLPIWLVAGVMFAMMSGPAIGAGVSAANKTKLALAGTSRHTDLKAAK
jgi:hypothetical protein